MPLRYSIYQAKSRLSEVIRLVKKHRFVIITERGHDIAKVVPLTSHNGIVKRLGELELSGIITTSAARPGEIRPMAKRPGALRRFLQSRD
ncbi:MAG: hypothetical protein HY538_07765 [Deltaproteobacteria bacterium]|nr:hypothetical protein [Deltaproteobacteria bacterium]